MQTAKPIGRTSFVITTFNPCWLAVWLASAMQVQAQPSDIDPLTLPPAGAERTYACRSNLNAISAMMQAQGMEKEARVLLGMYLSLDSEVISQAAAQGVSEENYRKRMTAWDSAVVVASLTNTDAVLKNMAPCMKMAAELDQKRAEP